MTTPAVTDLERLVRNLYRAILRREPDPDGLVHWTTKLKQGAELNEVIETFLNTVEFRNQQSAARLAYPPGHFYSPIVNTAEVASEFAQRSQQPVPSALPGISISLEGHVDLWHRMVPFLKEIPFPDEPSNGFRYHFRNQNYSYGDASVLYAMLRLLEPTRLIEIGSGFSSACSLDTIDRYLSGRVSITFIEPHADLLRQVLGEETMKRVDLREARVQDVPLSLFDDLADGDVLFIDSTHVLKTGSDVGHELFEILPRLAPGVFIHFHDIFWPFEYGENWVLEKNLSWNEIYGLRAFLTYNNEFEIVFFNDFIRRWQHNLIRDTYPKFLDNTGGSLWLRKREPLEIKSAQWIYEVSPNLGYVPSVSMSEATGEGEISEQLHQQIGKQTSEASGSIIGEVIGSPGAEAGIVRLRGSDESGDAGQATAQLGETCPNFSRLIRGVSDFATRLLELKNSAPVSFRWYLYHTLPNLVHIEPLITPEYDFLFQPTKRYADIGCADGDLAYYLESQGNKLHLYDCATRNGNQLLGARYLKTALRSAVEITEVDLDTQFPIEGEYDVLFFLGILYHLKNPFYVLERLSHVSRFMLLSTRIARHFYSDGADVARVPATYLLAPDECNDDPTNFWIFTEAGLKRLAERTGWDAVRFRTVGDNLHSNPQDKDHDERAFVLLRSRRRC